MRNGVHFATSWAVSLTLNEDRPQLWLACAALEKVLSGGRGGLITSAHPRQIQLMEFLELRKF